MTSDATRAESAARRTAPLLGYRPELDGVRALAVLAVMAAHSGIQLGNGYLGVEAFFVLSGYLITTLLVREHEAMGGIDFRRFYAKRALRLFPALVGVLALLTVWVVVVGDDGRRDPTITGIWASAFYVANWVRAAGHDIGLLRHTWSLAIEEQFYLLWPPVLALARVRGWSARRLAGLVAVVMVAVAVWRRVLHQRGADYERLYNGLDTRIDALMAGALLALLLAAVGGSVAAPTRRAIHVVGWVAAAVSAVTLAGDADGTILTLQRGVSVSALACLAMIAPIVVDPPTGVVRVLGWGPLVWIGRRSYGLYLWHFPLFKLLEGLKSSVGTTAYGIVAWVVSFAVAAASYRLIEAPFLARKARLRPHRRATAPAPAP